jgi:hypothetical protein
MKNDLYVPSGLFVYMAVSGLLHSTAASKATKDGDALLFGPTMIARCILLAGIVGCSGAAVYLSLTTPSSLQGIIVYGLISIVGTLAFPHNVVVTPTNVISIRWWGHKTTIPWKNVSRIEYHKGPMRTVVVGKNGARVVHSSWNRDTDCFLTYCEEKTGLSITTSER